MKKLWKVLIPVLAFAVVFACLFALGTSAATSADIDEDKEVLFSITQPDGTVKTCKALVDAVKYAKDGATIELLNDYNAIYCFNLNSDFLTKNKSETEYKSLTVDLKGHTIYASKLNGNQYIQLQDGNSLKFTSSEGKGKIVVTDKCLALVDANSKYQNRQNELGFENIDIDFNISSRPWAYYLLTVNTGVLTLRNVDINTTGTSTVIQTNATVSDHTVEHNFENVNITAGGMAVRVTLSGKTEDYIANWNNVSLSSQSSETYRIDGPKTAKVRINNSKIINTGSTLAFYGEKDMAMDIVLKNCEISTAATGDGVEAIRFNKVTSEGTMTFDRCKITSAARIIDTGTTADAETSNAVYNFINCNIDSAKYAFVGTRQINITGTDTRIKVGNGQLTPSADYTNLSVENGVRSTAKSGVLKGKINKFAEDGLDTDGYKYVFGAVMYEGSQQGDKFTYSTDGGADTKDVKNPGDDQLYRQLWVYGNGENRELTLESSFSVVPASDLKYLAFEMDISVLDDMPDSVGIFLLGRNSSGGGWETETGKYQVRIEKTTGGVNISFNGNTKFVASGHWAHMTMVFRLSTEVVDGVNQSAVSVFVDGGLLSTVSSGYFKSGFAKVSNVRMLSNLKADTDTSAHINVANLRLASYADADFESNVFSANPTVEGSDYLAGAKSDMADFTEDANKISGMKFNLTLYSNFNLNLYIPAKYLIDGEAVEIDGVAYTMLEYRFAANEVAVAQKITIGTYDTITVSVLDYAAALFSLDSITDAEKTLMADALVYANAAAKLIDNAEDAKITALLATYASYKTEPVKEITPVEKNIDAVKNGVTAAYLDLTSRPSFVFEIVSGSGVTITYTNFRGETVTLDETDAEGGKIVIKDMRIFDFAKEITITVGNNTATYSLANYAYSMKNDANTKNLCDALYTYILSARAFKNPKA